jgi:hypothetical protein
MIYQRLDFSDFCRAFEDRGRGDQFSTDALRLIYDHLDKQEQDVELDVIDICCEFAESSIEDLAEDFGVGVHTVRTHLGNKSDLVLGVTDNGTLVYAQF